MLGNFRGIPHHGGDACLDRSRPRSLAVSAPVSAGFGGQSGLTPPGADACGTVAAGNREMPFPHLTSPTAHSPDSADCDGVLNRASGGE